MTRGDILTAALTLLDEGEGKGLTMRALASRLGVTPMSLYHHVEDRPGLLRALADRVCSEVLEDTGRLADHRAEIRAILARYHDVIVRHPQQVLAIFAEPEAFAGVSRQISDRLASLLAEITPEHLLWRDVLVDHAHGSALARASARGDQTQADSMRGHYLNALNRLMDQMEKP